MSRRSPIASWRRNGASIAIRGVLAALLLPLILAGLPVGEASAQLIDRRNGEGMQIGLSSDRIVVSSDFSGADLTIFGTVTNLNPAFERRNQYEIVVVLTGPVRPITVRQKERVFGVWINTQSRTIAAPLSYSIAATAPLRDISSAAILSRLQLGVAQIGTYGDENDPADAPFVTALQRRQQARGLYDLTPGNVRFISSSLFRAQLRLPPSVPVGRHEARAFLFRAGQPVARAQEPLLIVKSDLEQTLFDFSRQEPFLYGLLAVVLAVLIGWLGRLVFRRD